MITQVIKYQNEAKAIVRYKIDTTEECSCLRVLKRVGVNRYQIVFDRKIYTFSLTYEKDKMYYSWCNIEVEEVYRSKMNDNSSILKEVKNELFGEKEPEKEEKSEEVSYDEDVNHIRYDDIRTCIELNIPVYLYGPAGCGKNHVVEQIAWDMGLEFYFTNSVQQEYKITGFIDAGGVYHETEFYRAFTKGGIFFLDEIDASIPEVLVLLNAAIANGYFEFPVGKVMAHDDFRVVAAGNTIGSGADEMYTGRLVLDQATLDRFAVIEFGYDERIELSIARGNRELVDFVHDIRKQADEKGIRCTFSYRCISMVRKLEESGMGILKILQIAVFKGIDKDTLNTFDVREKDSNRYMKSLAILKEVI